MTNSITKGFTTLSEEEAHNISGGFILTIAAVVVGTVVKKVTKAKTVHKVVNTVIGIAAASDTHRAITGR